MALRTVSSTRSVASGFSMKSNAPFFVASTAVLTVGYIAFTANHISWADVSAMPSGSAGAFVGTLIFAMTGFGLGWVNSGADYSRYLPRSASSRGVVGWTAFGASVCWGMRQNAPAGASTGFVGFDGVENWQGTSAPPRFAPT